MFSKVENNVVNAVAVLADPSYAARYAFFPGCYDEERNAWKGVECYENGTVGANTAWFTKCYLLKRLANKPLWAISATFTPF